MPAEWAVNAMALLGGQARGYAEGAQQRFGNQMAVRGQALQERQQMAGEKASQDQENRMRVQLRHDIQHAEEQMQFNYATLDVTKQNALMDASLRYEQNQQGWQNIALDTEKLKVLTDMDMYKFNNVPASQWAAQSAARSIVDQNGGWEAFLQSERISHEDKQQIMGFLLGERGKEADVGRTVRTAGGVAGATYPFQAGLIRVEGGEQRLNIGAQGVEQRAGIGAQGLENRRAIGYTGTQERTTARLAAELAPRTAGETARQLYPYDTGKMGYGATLERGTMQQGQAQDLQKMEYGGNIANQQQQQQAASAMQSNMMANPDVVQSWGMNVFQRWMGNFQSYLKGGYSPNQAALAADKHMDSDLAGLQVPDAVKYQIKQAAMLQRQNTFGNAPAQAAYQPYAQPRTAQGGMPQPQQQPGLYQRAVQPAAYQGLMSLPVPGVPMIVGGLRAWENWKARGKRGR